MPIEISRLLLTGRVGIEEVHARLEQIGEHGVVEIAARLHADFHEEETATQRGNGAGDDAECVYVYGVHGAEQAVRVQLKDQPKEAVVEHVCVLLDVTGVFDAPGILQVGPV